MILKPLFVAMLLLPAIAFPAQKPAAKPAPPAPPLLSHEVHADRSITFRFWDAAAAKVELNLEGVAKPIPMNRGKGGIWSFHTQPLPPEIYFYSFVDGGKPRIDPENHRIVPNLVFPASNAVEVPGQTPQPWDETGVPHGAVHTHRFTSTIARGLPANQEEVVVYTPPGYDAHAAKPYPVLYLLHGWSGVAEGWVKDQQANFIFDNLLAEGKIKPMVVVMPLGYGDMSFVQNGFDIWNDQVAVEHNTQLFMSLLTGEIMPMVEGAYNISRDREGRAADGADPACAGASGRRPPRRPGAAGRREPRDVDESHFCCSFSHFCTELRSGRPSRGGPGWLRCRRHWGVGNGGMHVDEVDRRLGPVARWPNGSQDYRRQPRAHGASRTGALRSEHN